MFGGLLANTNYVNEEHRFEHMLYIAQFEFVRRLHNDSSELNEIIWQFLSRGSYMLSAIMRGKESKRMA